MKKKYLFIFCLVLVSCSDLRVKREVSSTSKNFKVSFFDPDTLDSEGILLKDFDLNTQLGDLKISTEQYVRRYDAEAKSRKTEELILPKKQQFVEGKNLQKPFNAFDLADKGLYYGVKKILSLISDLDANPENRELKNYQILQMTRAIMQKYTPPSVAEYEILMAPITLLNLLSYPRLQTDNQIKTSEAGAEISGEFVLSEKPKEAGNLYAFGRVEFDADNCVYSKAKTGYGVHPGFQIKCGDTAFKVKFGNETNSGPFNSRIYASLGYKVPLINYSEGLVVKYDRRIFTEFNQRKSQIRKIKLAGQNVYEIPGQGEMDAFLRIKKFIMKDKSEISTAEAKVALLKTNVKGNAFEDEDFNSEFEKDIASVELNSASLTLKDRSNQVEVGPWRADELNYGQFKEVRALMVLSAWVGNFDVRKDNLAVYLENPKSHDSKIRMGFADAGSGLGKATFGLSKITSSEANDMVWEVSQTYKNNSSDSSGSDRIELIGLMNVETNKTFQNINLSDAQWMLQKICQIPRQNIKEALVAAGLSSAEVVLITEKLIYRRNKMLDDFLASKDLRNQCYAPADKKINYEPNNDGLIQVKGYAGELITAPARGFKVRKGVLTNQ